MENGKARRTEGGPRADPIVARAIPLPPCGLVQLAVYVTSFARPIGGLVTARPAPAGGIRDCRCEFVWVTTPVVFGSFVDRGGGRVSRNQAPMRGFECRPGGIEAG